jgi:hypothetical protein
VYTLAIHSTHPSEESFPWFESKSNLGSLETNILYLFETKFRIIRSEPKREASGSVYWKRMQDINCFGLGLKMFFSLWGLWPLIWVSTLSPLWRIPCPQREGINPRLHATLCPSREVFREILRKITERTWNRDAVEFGCVCCSLEWNLRGWSIHSIRQFNR